MRRTVLWTHGGNSRRRDRQAQEKDTTYTYTIYMYMGYRSRADWICSVGETPEDIVCAAVGEPCHAYAAATIRRRAVVAWRGMVPGTRALVRESRRCALRTRIHVYSTYLWKRGAPYAPFTVETRSACCCSHYYILSLSLSLSVSPAIDRKDLSVFSESHTDAHPVVSRPETAFASLYSIHLPCM